MLRADQEGITPEQLDRPRVTATYRDFAGLPRPFDNYLHDEFPGEPGFLARHLHPFKAEGPDRQASVRAVLRPGQADVFLPDRYIKGECPNCHSKDQYGDSAKCCGKTYAPTDLIDPYSVVSGAKPSARRPSIISFKLSDERCEKFLLREFHRRPSDALPSPKRQTKMKSGWVSPADSKAAELGHSRRRPLLPAFRSPANQTTKVFLCLAGCAGGANSAFSATTLPNRKAAKARPLTRTAFLPPGRPIPRWSTHGKDFCISHAPYSGRANAENSSGYRVPTNQSFAHGFLTVDGPERCPSPGQTFITAESYRQAGAESQWLRYTTAASSTATMEDIDPQPRGLRRAVDSDLVGKYVNIAPLRPDSLQTI